MKQRLSAALAGKIAAAREAVGWSQHRLAQDLSSINQSQISKWESGVHIPSDQNIRELAPALGQPTDEWLALARQAREERSRRRAAHMRTLDEALDGGGTPDATQDRSPWEQVYKGCTADGDEVSGELLPGSFRAVATADGEIVFVQEASLKRLPPTERERYWFERTSGKSSITAG